jgi:hypothetical protein
MKFYDIMEDEQSNNIIADIFLKLANSDPNSNSELEIKLRIPIEKIETLINVLMLRNYARRFF